MPTNPIENFKLEKNDIRFLGHDLHKPTSILATPDNYLWVTDARGGVVKISVATGEQQLILDQHSIDKNNDQPNSIVFVDKQKLMMANIARSRIEIFDLTTRSRKSLYDSIDGMPIGKVNYLIPDSKNRIWLSVSTRAQTHHLQALNPDLTDGYIALIENDQIRIVADGFSFTNEIRLDAKEEYLYIAETMGRRINRMKVHPNGTLTDRETFGPSNLGPAGFPDGIAFDSYGNLWGTIVGGEKIFAITPKGDLKIIFDDGNVQAIKKIDEAYQQRTLTPEVLLSGASKIIPLFVSITFGGKDLRTVFVGSYGTSLPYFTAPVSGQKPIGWK